MDELDEKAIAALLDKDAIRDCMARYCRGIDRRDEAMLRSAYWPGASDHHGPYVGDAEGFIAWALAGLTKNHGSVHTTGTQLIDLKGNKAAVETYFFALQRTEDNDGTQNEVALWGRYLDVFEKRTGEWRIAERTVVYDWMDDIGKVDGKHESRFGPRTPLGRQAPHDPLYEFLSRVLD